MQLRRIRCSVVERFRFRQVLRLQPVNAAVGTVDAASVVAAVVDTLLVEIGHVNAAVRAGFDVDRAEPLVAGFDNPADVARLE